MKSVPAFSKSKIGGSTVCGGGKRAGFTDHVKSTNAGKSSSSYKDTAGSRQIGSAPVKHPAFKSHSGAAGKSVPAFSKKKI
jgi:hypothetical protein